MLQSMIVLGLLATLPTGGLGLIGCGTLIENKCPNSDVTFWLYTKNQLPYKINEASTESIQNAPFNNNTIKILVHGYSGSKDDQINEYLRPEYLDLDYNVISVDYSPATAAPCYVETVINAPIISRCFLEFLVLLLKTENRHRKITLDDIHVLGFSMGAQISGKMGNDLKKEYCKSLKRLTGLDAAGPLYPLSFSEISSKSARFVDGIHTNGAIYGKLLQIGHVDFYCNINPVQPGCSPIDLMCSHVRSLEYYAESIKRRPKKFCGQKALSPSVEMGERVPQTAYGMYFVTTNTTSPYALDGIKNC